jgi:hypothetical protein
VASVDVGIAVQRLDNPVTDVAFDSSGRDGDAVDDVTHASNVAHRLFRLA